MLSLKYRGLNRNNRPPPHRALRKEWACLCPQRWRERERMRERERERERDREGERGRENRIE